ncbi:MAG: T9SS type A sorting domain-containing protein [Bacteroidales bacterium]|nr:T9SS type A sorting domain-containing protein [Bacteroidales bacterium]
MNKYSLVLFILVIIRVDTQAQSCLPEGITFTTQAQVDSFQVNYPNCSQIEGDVTIGQWDIEINITHLNGLSVLNSIGGTLKIWYTDSLTSLTGLEGLTFIGGGLSISVNDALTSLSGLNNVTSIHNEIEIDNNAALTSLTGLNNVTSVGGYIHIQINPVLTSLTGLDNVTSIGGSLWILHNPVLTNLEPLHKVDSIMDFLWIYSNNALTSLEGLENITYVGEDLSISGNPLLTSMTGLEGLTFIGGIIVLDDNIALTSITSLANVTSIGGRIEFDGNWTLTSLIGLDNISAGSITGINIINNYALSTCEVQSICDYLAIPNGFVQFYNNATGCNSQEEVETACLNGVDETTIPDNQIKIFPNPSSTSITLSLPSTITVNSTTLSIRNVSAQQVLSRCITEPITILDIGTLPRGVYIVKITDNSTVEFGKFVKQ